MALIECKECGKQISDSAKTCPNCGCKTAFAENSSKLLGYAIHMLIDIVVALIAGFALLQGTSELLDNLDRFDRWLERGEPVATFLRIGIGLVVMIGALLNLKNVGYEFQWYSKNPAQSGQTNASHCDAAQDAVTLPGQWTCSCGRNNAAYVSTCSCGKSKREQ